MDLFLFDLHTVNNLCWNPQDLLSTDIKNMILQVR